MDLKALNSRLGQTTVRIRELVRGVPVGHVLQIVEVSAPRVAAPHAVKAVDGVVNLRGSKLNLKTDKEGDFILDNDKNKVSELSQKEELEKLIVRQKDIIENISKKISTIMGEVNVLEKELIFEEQNISTLMMKKSILESQKLNLSDDEIDEILKISEGFKSFEGEPDSKLHHQQKNNYQGVCAWSACWTCTSSCGSSCGANCQTIGAHMHPNKNEAD